MPRGIGRAEGRGVPKTSNPKPKLPTLNCALDEEIERAIVGGIEVEDCLVGPIVAPKLYPVAEPTNVASIPLPPSSRNGKLLELSESEWPDLTQKPVEQCEIDEAARSYLEDSSSKEQDDWEVLSALGSVWTVDDAEKSFRDAVLAYGGPGQGGGEAERKTPARDKIPSNTKSPPRKNQYCFAGDDDNDILEALRDGYKNGRGGKAAKMYNRERKGRYYGSRRGLNRGDCRASDAYGRYDQRKKESQSALQSCNRLIVN